MKKLLPLAMILLLAGALVYISGCTESKPCASRGGTCLKSGGCCGSESCKKAAPKCCGKESCKMPTAPGSTTPAPAPAHNHNHEHGQNHEHAPMKTLQGGGCGGCGS